MVHVYHCKQCGYEWESIDYESVCPECGADIEVMVELSQGTWSQSVNNINETQRGNTRRSAAGVQLPGSVVEDIMQLSETGRTLSIADRRREIEDIYRTKNEHIKGIIKEYLNTVVVDSEDKNFLVARMSEQGEIEIIEKADGNVIPWQRLDDDEQWGLWLCFNDLIDEIDRISE